ncbi:MAG: helix-turn-helix domain-containing protein [Eubacteriales bacterium]
MEIGEIIKKKRIAAGLTQEQLASQIPCNRASIAQYELGIKTPGIGIVSRIADVFGCTVDELLRRDAE